MFNKIYESLNQASLFELFRLKDLVNKILNNPEKLKAIRNQLRPHQKITYFDSDTNQDVIATILEINRTTVLVKNTTDGRNWLINLYMMNLNSINTEVKNKHNKIDKMTLKVGDSVGFLNHRTNQELYGRVTKLNPKTASVKVVNNSPNPNWRVSYSALFYVMDTTKGYLKLG